jgi:late competence protein required for DNA uptake (superfamily II DNA/RNA helicase)
MEKIITPQNLLKEKLEEEIWLMGKALEQECIKRSKSKKCPRCGRKDRLKIVPLHEDPFPLPSKIVLYCDACKHNEIIMARDTDKMMKHYTTQLEKDANTLLPPESRTDKNEKVIKDSKVVDSLIKSKK